MPKSEWKKKQEQAETRAMLDSAEFNCGMHKRAITGLIWKNSGFYVQFNVGGKTKQINIAPECRERLGRLTKSTRAKVEATMPNEIDVETSYVTYYQQNRAYNIGGIRYLYSLDEWDLDDWLDKAANQ